MIVVAELYAGIRDEDEREKIDEFVGLFPIIPVTLEIAKSGGLYKRDFLKSHGVGLADYLLAAAAVIHESEFKTLNTRHYPILKDLKPPLLSGSCRALCHRFQQPDDSKSPGANINRNTVHNLRLAGFKNISVTDLWFDIVKKIIAVNVK